MEIDKKIITQSGIDGKKSPWQNQLDSSSRFDTIPTCDGQTDGHMHNNYKYRASTASRSKNGQNSLPEQEVRVILGEYLLYF